MPLRCKSRKGEREMRHENHLTPPMLMMMSGRRCIFYLLFLSPLPFVPLSALLSASISIKSSMCVHVPVFACSDIEVHMSIFLLRVSCDASSGAESANRNTTPNISLLQRMLSVDIIMILISIRGSGKCFPIRRSRLGCRTRDVRLKQISRLCPKGGENPSLCTQSSRSNVVRMRKVTSEIRAADIAAKMTS